MKLRIATLADYRTICDFYTALLKTVYTDLKLGEQIMIDGAVQNWWKLNHDIIIVETNEGEPVGFSLAYKDSPGIYETVYQGELAYVLPEYRHTKAAYLLYHNIVQYADKLGLPILSKGFIGDGGRDQIEKIMSRFGKPRFVEFCRVPH